MKTKYEKWFTENQHKFDYPALANKSAKKAWNESRKQTIKDISDLGGYNIDLLCVEWEETRNMVHVMNKLVSILNGEENEN